jgi:NAD-dependent dihydropyrimidine dehydrogenase PreA subunit
MKIDPELCIACEVCLPYCPMEAISMKDDMAVIDDDECVDCNVCLKSGCCPVDAFVFEPAPWPRSVRNVFSDPRKEHPETKIAGRGTEEMKTNDVTGRFQRGWIGMGCEFGRPGIGARFRDIDKVAQVLAKHGAEFEPKNPVTGLMEDPKTGQIKKDVLNEKVLSGIIECLYPIEKFEEIMNALKEVSKEIDTVFSCEVINRADPDGSYPLRKKLDAMGIPYYINGKQNVGLGRPVAKV